MSLRRVASGLAVTAFYFMLVMACGNSWASDPLSAFWTLDEFVQEHPEEIALERSFAERVRAEAEPLSLEQSQPIKIAVIYPGEQVSDYWRRNLIAFEARLKELGVDYRLKSYFTRPAVEERQQIKYILAALQDDPDYLVFTLDSLRHKRVIERVINKGRPKLLLQNITTPVRQWRDNQPFFYVGFDHMEGTRLLADYYLERTGGNADFGVIYFSRGYVSAARGDTFIEMMTPHPGMHLRTAYYTDADRRSAHKASLAALKEYPDLRFLYACSTDVAMGTVDALRESGRLGKVWVNGWGGGGAELQAIRNGELDVTVMRMNDDTGVAMAEAIGQDLLRKPVPTVYSGEFALVTGKTSEAQLKALEAKAFRYSR